MKDLEVDRKNFPDAAKRDRWDPTEEDGVDEDEDDGDEEEDYTDEETDLPKTSSEGDLYMHGPSSFADETSGLGESFGGMSISPAPLRPIA